MINNEDIRDIKEVTKSFALTTSRIESLSDSIFAFAMTLLVLGFQVPSSAPTHTLFHTLLHLQNQFTTYLLSFIVLGGLWVAHHNQYFWIKRSNRTFLWINMVFLLFVALIPFSTKVLAGYADEYIAIVIYGINIVICLTMLYFQWFYATRKKVELVENLNDRIVVLVETRLLFLIILNIITVSVSFFSPDISIGMLIAIQFFAVAPTITIDRVIIESKRLFIVQNT